MLVQDACRFDDEARKAFAEYLELRMAQPRFVNARSVRNALERARLRQATAGRDRRGGRARGCGG
jgi:AAA lid domain-containing protein